MRNRGTLLSPCLLFAAAAFLGGAANAQSGPSFDALAPIARAVGSEASLQSVALADLNDDGRIDLINVDNDAETVSIALGLGDGTFAEPTVLEAGDFPNAVAVADLTSPFDSETEGDIDGLLDVIVVDDIGGVQIFIGRGDGTFDPPDQSFDDLDAIELVGVAVADFDGNERLDVALLDAFDGVYLLCNNAGTLEPCLTSVVLLDAFIFNPVDIVAGDFFGDAAIDIAVIDSDTGELFVIPGFGDGTFEEEIEPILVAEDVEARALRIGRVDTDDIDDLVILTFDPFLEESSVTVFYGNDDGSELQGQTFAAAPGSAFALADFDDDGALDVLAVNSIEDGLDGLSSFQSGDGAGGFAAPRTPAGLEAVEDGNAVQSADIDGDGIPDFVAVIADGERMQVVLTGEGGPVCVGDCDGNGAVSVSELIRGVNIALELASLDICASFDVNGDGVVSVNELILAVNNALDGCA